MHKACDEDPLELAPSEHQQGMDHQLCEQAQVRGLG